MDGGVLFFHRRTKNRTEERERGEKSVLLPEKL